MVADGQGLQGTLRVIGGSSPGAKVCVWRGGVRINEDCGAVVVHALTALVGREAGGSL